MHHAAARLRRRSDRICVVGALLAGWASGCAAGGAGEDARVPPDGGIVGTVGGDALAAADAQPTDSTVVFDAGPLPDAALPPDDVCSGQTDADHCGAALGAGADHQASYRCVGGRTAETRTCPSGCVDGLCSAAPMDACGGVADGEHCGGTLIGGDLNRLYVCAGGTTTGVTECPLGCLVRPPGSPDTCRLNDDPCAQAPGDGAWCGGAIGADVNTLYACRGGTTAEARACGGGCAEAEGDDTCRAGDPCTGAGNGAYCGASLGGGDANTLYDCRNGSAASQQVCAAGCQQNPPGVADACRVEGDPCARANAGNGAYCGRTLGAGEADTLYDCRGGTTASQQVCPGGCQEMPPGVADTCRALGNPCEAAAVNGLYCGGSLGAGEVDTLYTCREGAVASASPCPAGCQQNPPGVPDQCLRGDAMCCLEGVPGRLTQGFSACGAGGQHYGVDHGVAIGTPIHAGMAGTIQGSRLGLPNCWNGGCSPECWNAFNYVKLVADCGDPDQPANDLHVWYLHIDGLAPGMADGVHVEQGQLIAFSGNSGCSSGPHIHLETASVPRGQRVNLNTCASVDPASRYCP